MRKPLLLLLSTALLLQCGKKHDPTPLEQLPPATQTGANTFGCLLNGQAWTPSGNDGRANYRVTYDPGSTGGDLLIRVYRYIDNTHQSQDFIIGGSPINGIGTYTINAKGPAGVDYFDSRLQNPCDEYYYGNPGFFSKGELTITRLDLQHGIIAGTFSFTLAQPGCDTINVTQGRFDKKL